MRISKKEELKASIRTSLSIIRFLVIEKKQSIGRADFKTIDKQVIKIKDFLEQL